MNEYQIIKDQMQVIVAQDFLIEKLIISLIAATLFLCIVFGSWAYQQHRLRKIMDLNRNIIRTWVDVMRKLLPEEKGGEK